MMFRLYVRTSEICNLAANIYLAITAEKFNFIKYDLLYLRLVRSLHSVSQPSTQEYMCGKDEKKGFIVTYPGHGAQSWMICENGLSPSHGCGA